MRRWSAGAAGLIAALVSAGCGGSTAGRTATARAPKLPSASAVAHTVSVAAGLYDVSGRFGGEIWMGVPHQIHAEWRVPGITTDSPAGDASTWIGAEGPGGDDGPFIQVGTREHRVGGSDGQQALDYYYAFWSDTHQNFSPNDRFAVAPGDRVSAQMTHTGTRWKVELTDLTSKRSFSLTTKEEGTLAFNEGQWLQEDVTNGLTNRAFPYPVLSTPAFSAVTVNGKVPPADQMWSQWLHARDALQGPTAFAHGGFSVVPKALSPAAATYLRAVSHDDTATDHFNTVALDWEPGDSSAHLISSARALLDAMTGTDRQLSAAHWPAAVAPLIKRLLSADATDERALRHDIAHGATAVDDFDPSADTKGDLGQLTHDIRGSLGAPQLLGQ